MMTNWTPILAMHLHGAGRGLWFLMAVVLCAVIIACWPGKSETK